MSPIDDKARHMQDQLNPPDVRYVKLGSGGKHVDYALENAVIPVDFDLADHALCLTDDWDFLMTTMTQAGRGIQAAKEDIRELKDFYDLPSGSLWITMARGHLWWALAGDKIELSDRSQRCSLYQTLANSCSAAALAPSFSRSLATS